MRGRSVICSRKPFRDSNLRCQLLPWRHGAVTHQVATGCSANTKAAIAKSDGRWLTLDVQEKFGSILKRGEQVGLVATLDDMVVKVAADQWSGPRLIGETDRDRDVEIRVDGWPDATYHGRITKVSPAGREQLPSPALSMSAGGRVMPDAKARRGDESAEPVFEIEIDVKDLSDAPPLLPGQRVMVRFPMPDRPILTQAWLYGRQLLQRRWAW